jgi:hypothetical protein
MIGDIVNILCRNDFRIVTAEIVAPQGIYGDENHIERSSRENKMGCDDGGDQE